MMEPRAKRQPRTRFVSLAIPGDLGEELDELKYACQASGVHPWHPHQLRHSFATRAREKHGLDAAQAVLGHKTARVTEIYAEKVAGLAKRVTDEMG